MRRIDRREVALDDGSKIVALDEPEPTGHGDDYRYSNNVFRFAPDGSVLWQIDAGTGVRDRDPFASLTIDDQNRLVGYRWSGGVYAIDVDTGVARYLYFEK